MDIVRQIERIGVWSERMEDESRGGGDRSSRDLAALIAASVRRERDRAGLSLTELAKRAGIAKSTLSQLESGVGNPSVETLWGLGAALGVPFSRLVDPPRPNVRVIRAGEGPVTYAEKADYAATLLSSCPPGARRDIYRIVVQPGEPRISEPHMSGTTEHVTLATGRALVGPNQEAVEIGPGDYVAYPGDVPHIFKALEPDTVAVMVMEHI
ncbi:helix-turn-helix domain-containing protein [Streptosporangium lutulentum]|uniref:Transcriptional regulator with XRE-family HTH domain n=1 Tax=Streptosporangium lutulentum TaxID=1461250 RepID=A0ABT9Q5T1_9ACTN|nr:helix-turn-helix domain-containing protein [Streptosporangium lutulentum]MDP9842087.1 transcriptional regulator with XRE-family HTH domain [Streptosporangium lutulentum]